MPRTIPSLDAHQDRLLARADASADAAERAIRRVWLTLLDAIRTHEGQPWFAVHAAVSRALAQLGSAAYIVAGDLAALHRDSATWTANQLAQTLPRYARLHLLRRRGLVEDESAFANLLAGILLPPLDRAAVNRVVFGSGWLSQFERLTRLAAPDALAARIAGAVARGLSVQQIAREIRPAVQGVQASARRIARTAGLWVAHEAEAEVYRGLEGDLIIGYTIRAVLDERTRPAHRARDGQQFFVRPGPGQRGMNECPKPPREADGSWAFNCRCFREPILAVG